MHPTQNPEYLGSIAQAVKQFRTAFDHFLALHQPTQGLAKGIAPAIQPRPGTEHTELARRRAAVDRAAGRAAPAPHLTGCLLQSTTNSAKPLDPLACWSTITHPHPILEPADIYSALDVMTGRLEQMITLARMADTDPCSLKEMHPVVWQAAATAWNNQHWLDAVRAATQAVLARVGDRLGWQPEQFNQGSPWNQVFADDPEDADAVPHLGLPAGVDQTSGHHLVAALRHVTVGLPVLVIDPALGPRKGLTRQDALERLAALSLLAWWLDRCSIIPAQAGILSATSPTRCVHVGTS